MAAEETRFTEAFPMKAGDGPNNYAKNSTYQRGVADAAKELLKKAIAEKLDTEILLSSNTFHIADLGCSVGPNTFYAVKNILEYVQSKYQSQGPNSEIPEFQVFFNDHATNDFNILFKSLPHDRQYHAAGVPGSFYGRVFPKASVHFVHSSYTNHWLSRVPKDVTDINSPAWNKGRIHYLKSTDEVVKAYEDQYARDMECFLHVRAQEIVNGGLMVLTIAGRPNGTPHSNAASNVTYQLLGTCLSEMAKRGVVSEDKVDAFNIPIYSMSPQELEAAVEKNGCFSVEGMEILPHVPTLNSGAKTSPLITSHVRAATEGLFKQHFGDAILDELFDLYCKNLVTQPCLFKSTEGDVREEKVDSFNIPMYTMSPQELKAAVERNGCFSIEIMSDLPHQSVDDTISLSQLLASHLRAGMEGIVKQHFGEEIIDELFVLYQKKCDELATIFKSGKSLNFLVVLRRTAD